MFLWGIHWESKDTDYMISNNENFLYLEMCGFMRISILFTLSQIELVLPKPASDIVHSSLAHQPAQLPNPDLQGPASPTQVPQDTRVLHLYSPLQNFQPIRRTTRVHRPLSYLQQYQCQVTFPIQTHLSYDHLSSAYKDYVLKVSGIFSLPFPIRNFLILSGDTQWQKSWQL